MNFYIKCRNLAPLLKMEKSVCWNSNTRYLISCLFPFSWLKPTSYTQSALLSYNICGVNYYVKVMENPAQICEWMWETSSGKSRSHWHTYSDCYSIFHVLYFQGNLKSWEAEKRSVWFQQTDAVSQTARDRHSRRGVSAKGKGYFGFI